MHQQPEIIPKTEEEEEVEKMRKYVINLVKSLGENNERDGI